LLGRQYSQITILSGNNTNKEQVYCFIHCVYNIFTIHVMGAKQAARQCMEELGFIHSSSIILKISIL